MKMFNSLLLEGIHRRTDKGIEDIYQCFVKPNEEYFKQNYLANTRMWNNVEYEKCAFDFIPVTDKEYLMIDKAERKIAGTYIVKPYHDSDYVKKTISSILIADIGDIREIMPALMQKRWEHAYFVLGQAKNHFASFFKLEEFLTTLPRNVKFFITVEEMRQYFLNECDAYLPKKIIAPEPERYKAIIRDIHIKRVQSGIHSNNVFLSICIPTCNRGEIALRAVRKALTTEFDSEIEILVSDNGSTIGVDGYKEIENTVDSRLRYYRFNRNEGYACNVMNCLQKAKGHFAIFFSDEDSLIIENIGTALDWFLNQKENIGACVFSGTGESATVYKEEKFNSGIDAIKRAYHMNYLTGSCFNLDYIKMIHLFEELESKKENIFYISYTHCVIGALLGRYFNIMNTDILLWHLEEIRADLQDWEEKKGIPITYLPEHRSLQSIGAIELIKDSLSGKDLEEIFLDRMNVYYVLLSELYKVPEYSNAVKQMYHWFDVCMAHYKNCLQELDKIKDRIENVPSFIVKLDKRAFYWLICKREQRLNTPEKNLLPALQAQVAKYYYDKGIPFGEIDFEGIGKELDNWVKNFLKKRSDLML